MNEERRRARPIIINEHDLEQAGRAVAEIACALEVTGGGDPNYDTFLRRGEAEAQTVFDALIEDLVTGGYAAELIARMVLDGWRAEQNRARIAGTMTERLFEALGIK